MSSHPPTVLTLARRAIRDHALFGPGARVLAAVSGGPDSMVLLHVLAVLRPELGHTLCAHGVDHGLRSGAAAELDAAEAFAGRLEVPFARTRVEVASGGNLQARAREARWRALEAAAHEVKATRIATAHHADDRAETLLLRLLRGAGPVGLAALPPRAGARIRPLILARREAILLHAERHRIAFARDPSNDDLRYLRVQVRKRVLPLLEELSPRIVDHLVALATQLAEATLPAPPLAMKQPIARRTRDALRLAMAKKSPDARVLLPGGLVATYDRAHDRLRVDADAIGPKNRRGAR